MTYERIFLTIHYLCGHDACRPIPRQLATLDELTIEGRHKYPLEKCRLCAPVVAFALRSEKRQEVAL